MWDFRGTCAELAREKLPSFLLKNRAVFLLAVQVLLAEQRFQGATLRQAMCLDSTVGAAGLAPSLQPMSCALGPKQFGTLLECSAKLVVGHLYPTLAEHQVDTYNYLLPGSQHLRSVTYMLCAHQQISRSFSQSIPCRSVVQDPRCNFQSLVPQLPSSLVFSLHSKGQEAKQSKAKQSKAQSKAQSKVQPCRPRSCV